MTSREDFSWTNEAKNLKGLAKKQSEIKKKDDSIVHIKLDSHTLPKDGQPVKFQTQDENWHDGYFISDDNLFYINDDKWFSAFDIVSWKSN